MTDRELMQMALDVLDLVTDLTNHDDEVYAAIEALRARLAEPEPEPVAWKDAPSKIYLQVCDESDCDQPFDSHIEVSWCHDKINDSDIAYIRADTAPPQREWQGLTDEEILEEYRQSYGNDGNLTDVYFARAIEAKLKAKNYD